MEASQFQAHGNHDMMAKPSPCPENRVLYTLLSVPPGSWPPPFRALLLDQQGAFLFCPPRFAKRWTRSGPKAVAVLLAMFVAACGDDTVQPPANQPPVSVAGISAQTVAVGDSVTVDLLAHFSDPDGDPLIFAAEAADKGVAAAAVSSGTLTIRAVAQGETTITATARDPGGLSASLTFSVVVPNRPPEVADSIPALELVAGDSTIVNLPTYFSDPDGDPLVFTAESADHGVATATVSEGTLTLRAVAQGATDVTVTARDPGEFSAMQTFAVTVPNRPPEVTDSIPAVELVTGDSTAIDLPAHFSDPDGDTLVFTAEPADDGVATAAVSDGTLTVRAVAPGVTEIALTAQDPGGLSTILVFSVSVTNRAPVAVYPIPTLVMLKDESRHIALSEHFSDPDGSTLSYTVDSSPAEVVRISVPEDKLMLTAVAAGKTEVTVTARDPGGLSASLEFEVTVAGTPDLGALIALYHATGGPYWDNIDNWLTDLPLDRWHGVETNAAGRVTGLDLMRNNLTGSIPRYGQPNRAFEALAPFLQRPQRNHSAGTRLARQAGVSGSRWKPPDRIDSTGTWQARATGRPVPEG